MSDEETRDRGREGELIALREEMQSLAALNHELETQLKMRENERDLLAVMLNEAEQSRGKTHLENELWFRPHAAGEFQVAPEHSPKPIAVNSLIELIPAAILVVSQQGIIKSVNRRTLRITGYLPIELIGQNIRVIFGGGANQNLLDEFILRSRRVEGFSRNLVKKDGTEYVAGVSLNVQSRQKEIIICILELMRDSDL